MPLDAVASAASAEAEPAPLAVALPPAVRRESVQVERWDEVEARLVWERALSVAGSLSPNRCSR